MNVRRRELHFYEKDLEQQRVDSLFSQSTAYNVKSFNIKTFVKTWLEILKISPGLIELGALNVLANPGRSCKMHKHAYI